MLNKFKAHSKKINLLKKLSKDFFAISSDDSTVKIWRVKDWSLILTYTGHSRPTHGLEYIEQLNAVASSSEGLNLFQINTQLPEPTIHLWSIKTGQPLTTIYASDSKFAGSVYTIKLLPNGELASGLSYEFLKSKIKLWNLTTSLSTKTYEVNTKKIRDLTLVNNDTVLASSSDDASIILMDYRSGAILHNLKGHNSSVYGLKVISSEIMASCSTDKTVKLWNTTDGSLIRTLSGHADGLLHSLAMLKENLLVSGSLDNTIKLWRVPTGQLVNTIDTKSQITTLIVI